MGFGHFPRSAFSGVTVRVVPAGTVYPGKDGPITINKGVMAFSNSGTAVCVQEDYDSLKRSIQGVEKV